MMPAREFALDPDEDLGQTMDEGLYEADLKSTRREYLKEFFKPARGDFEGEPSAVNIETYTEEPVVNRVPEKRHETRSRHAQTADESFNAPLAPTYYDWLAQPNRYDFPLVDTIPPERVLERADDYASEAMEAGLVSEVRDDDEVTRAGKKGRFRWTWTRTAEGKTPENPRILMNPTLEAESPGPASRSYGYTLAHEVGHAVDFNRARLEGLDLTYSKYYSEFEAGTKDVNKADTPGRAGKQLDRDLIDELVGLTTRGRGGSSSDYRTSIREITADALALRRIEPRAVKRDFPRADQWLGNLERESFGGGA